MLWKYKVSYLDFEKKLMYKKNPHPLDTRKNKRPFSTINLISANQ